jgi:hypothetical protein
MTGRETTQKEKTEKPVEKEAEEHRERMKEHADEVTISSDESFPASDPPSFNPGVTGASDVDKKKRRRS